MIKNREPMSLSESLVYLREGGKAEEKTKVFIKKFAKLTPNKSKELKQKLEALNLVKLKSESIIQIIDVLPDDAEDLNKIFTSVSLDEDETKKILEAIKSL